MMWWCFCPLACCCCALSVVNGCLNCQFPSFIRYIRGHQICIYHVWKPSRVLSNWTRDVEQVILCLYQARQLKKKEDELKHLEQFYKEQLQLMEKKVCDTLPHEPLLDLKPEFDSFMNLFSLLEIKRVSFNRFFFGYICAFIIVLQAKDGLFSLMCSHSF